MALIKKLLCFASLCGVVYPEIPYTSAQSLASVFYSQFNFFRLHSRSLFARNGELRDNTLNNGVWVNEEFGFLKNRELDYALEARDIYNHFSFGIDTLMPKTDLYLGGSVEIVAGKTQSHLYGGDKGSYALGVYGSYIHPSRFFVDVNMKYFYSTQNMVFKNSSLSDFVYGEGSSNFYIGINIGQRLNTSFSPFLPSFFFLEPTLSLESGYLPSQSFGLRDGVSGNMNGFAPLGIKANLAFGREWNEQYKGSLKGGVSLEYDHKINGKISLNDGVSSPIYLKERQDFRVGFFVEADFILNSNFRFFLRSNSTFLGKLNTLYAMNVGMRFSFGKITQHKLHSKDNINWNQEGLQ